MQGLGWRPLHRLHLQKFVTACPKTKAHAKRVGRVAHDHSRPVEIARWTRQSDSKVRCSSLLYMRWGSAFFEASPAAGAAGGYYSAGGGKFFGPFTCI